MEKMTSKTNLNDNNNETADKDRTMAVSFDDVKVFEFPVVIGDNPAVREGCPVQMGDQCLQAYSVDIESYEMERSPRLRGKDLYIPVPERAAM